MPLANGTHNYTLTGVVQGTAEGFAANGVTVQLTINTGKGYFNGCTMISSGDTNVVAGSFDPAGKWADGTGWRDSS